MQRFDVAVIGGGIVGLASAYQISKRFSQVSICLLEKERSLGEHQTGHNSGVLHSGIYYQPGSLKAINCREGKLAMEAFCREHAIAHEICGKVIVAVNDQQRPALERIYQRGVANGIRCEMIGPEALRELEPHVAGVAAIHVPVAGIVNYRQVCQRLGELLTAGGHQILHNARVTRIANSGNEVVIESTAQPIAARLAINCAGLYSDRVTHLSGAKPAAKIVPFRGEYYKLRPEAEHLCRHLIYPVPDPKFPFLGVHFTRMIEGGVECGPNAVLAFAREGYTKWKINPFDLGESLVYPGFIRMALKHWRMGMGEMWRSFSKAAFVRALQQLVPEIQSHHLESAPAGVRAQAVTPDGKLVDDFLIVEVGRMIHVNNAPSPAATASLNIGSLIADKAEKLLTG